MFYAVPTAGVIFTTKDKLDYLIYLPIAVMVQYEGMLSIGLTHEARIIHTAV